MSLFNSKEIAQMRVDGLLTLPDTGYIVRETPGTGLYGGHNASIGTAGTVSYRLDRISRQDSTGIIADAEVGRTYYRLTLPYNADLRDGDDFKAESKIFTVLQVSTLQSADVFVRAVCATKDEGN